jgi:polyhydroxyalkanoate synthesis regulator phasin
MGYFVDSLFRAPKGGSAKAATPEQSTAEVARIFTNAAAAGKLPPEDARHVAQVVAQRTGMSQAEAEKRVNDTFNQMQAKKQEAETAAREAADKARKASAVAALWMFISLLIGAFIASMAATWGGRQRDD